MVERGGGLVSALLGAAVAVLLVASVAVLVFVDFGDDSPSTSGTSATPSRQNNGRPERSTTTQPSGPPQPVSNACTLVSLESVASAIGAKAADVKPEPANQALGPKCDFKAPEGEDVLIGFTLQLTEANDASFARSTIEARNGKRIAGLGDVAVLEQSDVGSQISVVKGSRYVQLQTRRKAATDDAMIELGRQAASKL
jgi:FlaG/FlaF family flagellin (archaellin)